MLWASIQLISRKHANPWRCVFGYCCEEPRSGKPADVARGVPLRADRFRSHSLPSRLLWILGEPRNWRLREHNSRSGQFQFHAWRIKTTFKSVARSILVKDFHEEQVRSIGPSLWKGNGETGRHWEGFAGTVRSKKEAGQIALSLAATSPMAT